jgi:hypothetical protein
VFTETFPFCIFIFTSLPKSIQRVDQNQKSDMVADFVCVPCRVAFTP